VWEHEPVNAYGDGDSGRVHRTNRVEAIRVVWPDDLNRRSSLLEGLDRQSDVVWMCELGVEQALRPAGPPVHKQRVALVLASMRHLHRELAESAVALCYHAMDGTNGGASWQEALEADIARLLPRRVLATKPGDIRVEEELRSLCSRLSVQLEVQPDAHFFSGPEDFAAFMEGRTSPFMEAFYRRQRRGFGVLMTESGKPVGGSWNYDKANRRAFPREGPGELPPQPSFPRDRITAEAIALTERLFSDHPGDGASFDLPVIPEQAREGLQDFVERRLHRFGDVQDAMWTGEPFLYHSRLSGPLNLKLLDPREAVSAAETAYRDGAAPLNAAEGFVRQLLGWREFVRGVYFHYMPDYARANALGAWEGLPWLYWSGETGMRCLREVVAGLRHHGYAHHIQRLMVAGLFALLYGVEPSEFNAWHLAMYIDAYDWVSVPNTMGMTLHADGGLVGTKPYCASGKYIARMSNYCRHCRFDSQQSSGEEACPFTTLYWSFLSRHAERFSNNRRMQFQIKNLRRKSDEAMRAIRERENEVRRRAQTGTL